MKKFNRIRKNFTDSEALRWVLIALGVVVAALLAATLETARVHAEAQQGNRFRFMTALVRVITPNGDKKNDKAILCVDNPQDFAVRAKIIDLRGHKVADMEYWDMTTYEDLVENCPPAGGLDKRRALVWDGKSNGTPVSSGVYIYRIRCESKAVTGTILVVR